MDNGKNVDVIEKNILFILSILLGIDCMVCIVVFNNTHISAEADNEKTIYIHSIKGSEAPGLVTDPGRSETAQLATSDRREC